MSRKYAAQALADEAAVFDAKIMEEIGMKVDDIKKDSNLTPLVPTAFLGEYEQASLNFLNIVDFLFIF